MKTEFFSAGCRLCERALETLRSRFPELDMEIHLASECVDGSCCKLAEEYGIRAVPSVVVNGSVVLTGSPDKRDLETLAQIFAS